jgi:hypothetical protein
MDHIVTVGEAVTAFAPWMEPTDAELDALAAEAPVIDAGVELLDVQIAQLDRPANELDTRRLRRARRNLLFAHVRVAAARTRQAEQVGGAA